MNINSIGASNFNLNVGQNKNETGGVLEKLAALRTLSNESPADLAIYNQQQSDLHAASQKIQNANESYSMLRMGSSALQSLKEGATELHTKSVARNSAALSSEQKAMIDADSNALLQAMGNTVAQTSYNGQQLLSDIELQSIDAKDPKSVENFMDMLSSRLSDAGAAMHATLSEINEQSSLMTNVASSKEIKEYDVADLKSQLDLNGLKLHASVLAQAHSSDTLGQRVSALLA